MLTGHVAIALGAHGIRKSAPLWLLIAASQLPDWTDAVVCATGLRPSVTGMYSHSFGATVVLAAIVIIVSATITRHPGSALLAGAVVLTHVAGDYVTGIKPTWPGGPMIGMQLYDRPALDFVFEIALLSGCWLLYRRSFPVEKRAGRQLLVLPAVLIAIQALADIVIALSPAIQKC